MNVKIMDPKYCEAFIRKIENLHYSLTGLFYPKVLSEDIQEYFICTYQIIPEEIAPLKGDLGGPLLCNGKQYGVATVIQNHTIFTRVGPYLNWINDVVSAIEPETYSTSSSRKLDLIMNKEATNSDEDLTQNEIGNADVGFPAPQFITKPTFQNMDPMSALMDTPKRESRSRIKSYVSILNSSTVLHIIQFLMWILL